MVAILENRGISVKKIIYILGLACIFLTGFAFAAEQKIAVIDVISILHSMPEREQVAKKLDNEFRGRARALQAEETQAKAAAQRLQKEGMTLSTSDKAKLSGTVKAFEQKAQKFSQDYRKRENEEGNKLLSKIRNAVIEVVKKDHYSVVMKAEAAFYADSASDITDKVLEQVKKQ